MSNLCQYVCSACQQNIREHVLLECDRKYFHSTCLKCQYCRQTPSSGQKLYAFNGLLLCKEDYTNLKSACHVCRQRIEPQDYRFCIQNTRQSVHMSCMSCSTCRVSLESGDKYVLSSDQRLLCHKCHHVMTTGTTTTTLTTTERQPTGRRGRKRATNH